jgi:hypothetical protein
MNTNEIRWRLHNYYTDSKKIEQLKLDLKEYRLRDGVKAQMLSDMPKGDGISSEDRLISRIDYIRDLESELDSLMRVKRAIDSIYLYLKDPQLSIIEMRYFITPEINDIRQRKYNWKEIADEVKYSEDYCKEIDGKVVFQIQNKIHEITLK